MLIGLSDEKDSEGNIYPHEGMVDFTDNRVDVQHGHPEVQGKDLPTPTR